MSLILPKVWDKRLKKQVVKLLCERCYSGLLGDQKISGESAGKEKCSEIRRAKSPALLPSPTLQWYRAPLDPTGYFFMHLIEKKKIVLWYTWLFFSFSLKISTRHSFNCFCHKKSLITKIWTENLFRGAGGCIFLVSAKQKWVTQRCQHCQQAGGQHHNPKEIWWLGTSRWRLHVSVLNFHYFSFFIGKTVSQDSLRPASPYCNLFPQDAQQHPDALSEKQA